MHQRLQENQVRKAQRGELHLNLPVGLVYVPHIGVQLDPDEQVQGAVRLLFERYRLSHRMSTVVRYFHDNGLLFPRHRGTWQGPLEWHDLCLDRVRDVLANPLYAGAYVYGRTRRTPILQADQPLRRPRQRLPEEAWAVAHWDAFPGYIPRAEFEANQTELAHNRDHPHVPSHSHRRDGPALLGGLLLCGRCGLPMHVGYQAMGGKRSVYLCNTRQIRYGESACQRVPGKAVDAWVTERVMAALTPAQIELSLALVAELERQQAELTHQWQRRLEAARYAANLTQRRYEQVDPANRLVARSLEQQWEAALQEVQRLETEFTAFGQHKPVSLGEEQRQALLRLATDLPRVWFSPTTTWAERKDLLELLIADVTLTRSEAGIQVQIRWFTNTVETGQLPVPVRRGIPISASLIERLRSLSGEHTDAEIAEILNQEGVHTPMGYAFTAQRVEFTRRRNGIPKYPRAANS